MVFSIKGAATPPVLRRNLSPPSPNRLTSSPIPLNNRIRNAAMPAIHATLLPDNTSLVSYKKVVHWQGHRYLLETLLPSGQIQKWDEIVKDLENEVFNKFPTNSPIHPGTREMEFGFIADQCITVTAGNDQEFFMLPTHKKIVTKFLDCYYGGSQPADIASVSATATPRGLERRPPGGRVLSTLEGTPATNNLEDQSPSPPLEIESLNSQFTAVPPLHSPSPVQELFLPPAQVPLMPSAGHNTRSPSPPPAQVPLMPSAGHNTRSPLQNEQTSDSLATQNPSGPISRTDSVATFSDDVWSEQDLHQMGPSHQGPSAS